MDEELRNFLIEYLSDNDSFFTYFQRTTSNNIGDLSNRDKQELFNSYLISIMETYFNNKHYKNQLSKIFNKTLKFLEQNKPENTEKFCIELIRYCPHWLQHVPEKYQTQELCLYTISIFQKNWKDPVGKTIKQIKDPSMKSFINLISVNMKPGPNAIYD